MATRKGGLLYVHGTSSSEHKRLEIQNRLAGGSAFLPKLKRGVVILDAACGTGSIARELAAEVFPGSVTAVDLRSAQIAAAGRISKDISKVMVCPPFIWTEL